MKEDRIKKEDKMDHKERILRNGSGRGKIIIHQGKKIRRKVDQRESGLGGKRIGRGLPEEKGSKAKMIRKQNNFNYIIHAHHINIFSSKINYCIYYILGGKKDREEKGSRRNRISKLKRWQVQIKVVDNLIILL